MNRMTKGALTALAVLSIGVAACQNQGTTTPSIDTEPSIDIAAPSDGGTGGSMDMSPSMSPEESDS